ncbi:MAG: hypothetical protein AB1847_15790 [bacterium]
MFTFRQSFILPLALAVIICGMQILDAPAYAHCEHIEICEFLDVLGILENAEKSQRSNRDTGHGLSSSRLSGLTGKPFSGLPPCFSVRKKRCRMNFEQYFLFFYRDQSHGILESLVAYWLKNVSLRQTYVFESEDRKSRSQALQIVEISIIQS